MKPLSLFHQNQRRFCVKLKKMKTTTLAKRLEKSSVNKSSIACKIVKDLIENTNKTYCVGTKDSKIWTCYTSGKGRFLRNMDYTNDVIKLFTELKLKFTTGNDAPRGGATGKFVKLITKLEIN